MKPRIGTSIILFISAYSPLFLLIAVKDFDFEGLCFNHVLEAISIICVSILSLIFLFASLLSFPKGSLVVTVKRVTPKSLDVMNYAIPYFFSIFDVNVANKSDLLVLGLLLALLLALTIRSNAVFMNPLIGLAGYQYYEVEYEANQQHFTNICIAKKVPKNDSQLNMLKISTFIYFSNDRDTSS